MAQTSVEKPTPSVDEIVAALLVLGIDLSVAGLTSRRALAAAASSLDAPIRESANPAAPIGASANPATSISEPAGEPLGAPAPAPADTPIDEEPANDPQEIAAELDASSAGLNASGTGMVACTEHSSGGFVCGFCKMFNIIQTSISYYYVVTVGLDVGIFTDWHVVNELVLGVSGSCCKKYKDEKVARAFFQEALEAGRVKIVTPGTGPITVHATD